MHGALEGLNAVPFDKVINKTHNFFPLLEYQLGFLEHFEDPAEVAMMPCFLLAAGDHNRNRVVEGFFGFAVHEVYVEHVDEFGEGCDEAVA